MVRLSVSEYSVYGLYSSEIDFLWKLFACAGLHLMMSPMAESFFCKSYLNSKHSMLVASAYHHIGYFRRPTRFCQLLQVWAFHLMPAVPMVASQPGWWMFDAAKIKSLHHFHEVLDTKSISLSASMYPCVLRLILTTRWWHFDVSTKCGRNVELRLSIIGNSRPHSSMCSNDRSMVFSLILSSTIRF